MKIVIDIPEEVYKEYMNLATGRIPTYKACDIAWILKHGTPLPKGHGDLIDRDDLLADSYCISDWSGNEINIVDVMTVKMADVIIEADGGDKE